MEQLYTQHNRDEASIQLVFVPCASVACLILECLNKIPLATWNINAKYEYINISSHIIQIRFFFTPILKIRTINIRLGH